MTSTALSPRQNRFVQSYCGHLNASRAAREAGYSSSSGADSVTACRLLGNNRVKKAVEALQQAHAREMELTRQDVIQAILGAIQTATEQGVPSVMIRGWVEIAKITGLDKPESVAARHDVPLSPGAQRLQEKLAAMTTEELKELVATGKLNNGL